MRERICLASEVSRGSAALTRTTRGMSTTSTLQAGVGGTPAPASAILVGSVETCPNLGNFPETGPKMVETRSIRASAKVDRTLSKVGQIQRETGRNQQDLAKTNAKLGDAKFGRDWAGAGQTQARFDPNSAKCWAKPAEVSQVEPGIGQNWISTETGHNLQHLAQTRGNLGRCRPKPDECQPNLGYFGSMQPDVRR